MRSQHLRSNTFAFLAGTALIATPALAAEVTPDRLINADKEPQNWLMNHRTYDAQRYSPLDRIHKENAKNLKLAYAVALGGTSVNMNLESTPLAEDGFLYVVDQWGVLYKIDGRSGDAGRIVWRMDPNQEKLPLANRGAALWGNVVASVASFPARVIATDKETGKIVWESNVSDGQADIELTAAPLPVKDKLIVGASGGDHGVRDFIVALDAATGKLLWRRYVIPAPGERGAETWKDHNNAWQTGGGAMWVTGSYDPASNQVFWGTGNPVPPYDPYYRPGDNLYTNSLISWNPDTGWMNWYHQYVPGDMWDYDAAGTHILIDGEIDGQPHKIVVHSQRNGFLYSFDRINGQALLARPYQDKINWTKGIDQKTGLPVDYDPNRDVQIYSGVQNMTPSDRTKELCPSHDGGSNFWSASYSRRTNLLYIPTRSTCDQKTMTQDHNKNANGLMSGGVGRYTARNETDLVVADPFTGEIKNRTHAAYPDNSAALTTAGGLLITGYTDGTIAAYDDVTLAELWHFNLGSGINAPPMTFAVGDKQYLVVQTGLNRNALNINSMTPELHDMRNQTMLFVFGL